MANPLTEWSISQRESFSILPSSSNYLDVFLDSDGHTPDQILGNLPYRGKGSGPNPRRYRAYREVFQTIGLVYEESVGGQDVLKVTELGEALRRWLKVINNNNYIVIGRHAAYALAACQLRNPIGAGRRYAGGVKLFPFAFIWRVMLAIDGKINSDELSRAVLKATTDDDFDATVQNILQSRDRNNPTLMGPEVVSDNDRIIPWMAYASFGWTLISDKGTSGYYEIKPQSKDLLRQASSIRYSHKEFDSPEAYSKFIAASASLPPDLR